ncbi:MAG: efflux transporter periplasmic adaptor subunit [Gammaproteobacteria bacterium]|nr:efflux transporter periplasmic adaptor subunit [Gammaproteobacteria bacterium]
MKIKFLPLIVIIVAFVIAGLMSLTKPDSLELESPNREVAVKTAVIQKSQVQLKVKSQGTVQPLTKTMLVSEVSGIVMALAPQFEVGGTFAKGDVLIKLDPADYQVAKQRADAQLQSAKAQLLSEQARSTQAKKEWEMTGRPLSEAPVLALRSPFLAEAQSRLLQAQAEVKQAELKLQRTVIRAPYAGMISATMVDVGQYVTIGARLGETFAIDFAEIRLPMTDKDLSKLGWNATSADQSIFNKNMVQLKSTVNGEIVTWQAVLVRSEGTIEQSSRVQYLVAQVADPYNIKGVVDRPRLLIGSFVEAMVSGKMIDDVYTLPRHALRSNNRVATVDSDQRLKLLAVDYTYEDHANYYVNAGLEGQVEVVTSGMGIMVDGMKLKPFKFEDKVQSP